MGIRAAKKNLGFGEGCGCGCDELPDEVTNKLKVPTSFNPEGYDFGYLLEKTSANAPLPEETKEQIVTKSTISKLKSWYSNQPNLSATICSLAYASCRKTNTIISVAAMKSSTWLKSVSPSLSSCLNRSYEITRVSGIFTKNLMQELKRAATTRWESARVTRLANLQQQERVTAEAFTTKFKELAQAEVGSHLPLPKVPLTKPNKTPTKFTHKNTYELRSKNSMSVFHTSTLYNSTTSEVKKQKFSSLIREFEAAYPLYVAWRDASKAVNELENAQITGNQIFVARDNLTPASKEVFMTYKDCVIQSSKRTNPKVYKCKISKEVITGWVEASYRPKHCYKVIVTENEYVPCMDMEMNEVTSIEIVPPNDTDSLCVYRALYLAAAY